MFGSGLKIFIFRPYGFDYLGFFVFLSCSLLKNICSLLMFVGLFNPFNYLLEWSGSNWIKSDQTRSNQIKLDKKWSRCIRLTIWFKLDKICPNWFKLDKIRSIWTNCFNLDQNMSSCSTWFKLVPTRSEWINWTNLDQIG